MEKIDIDAIIEGLISQFFWVVILAVVTALSLYGKKWFNWALVGSLRRGVAIFCVLTLIQIATYLLGYATALSLWIAALTACLAIIIWTSYRFQRVGVVDAFPTTLGGIDYRSSLTKSHHTFDFLGVGAHKLTSLPEFDEMIRRCASASRPVRLLLSPPDNPLLETIAARTGTERTKYGDRVRESLAKISKLRLNEGFNIEVRFYSAERNSDYQQFRLVFIDDRYCILSHTIWDREEGRSNPQLVLHARARDKSSNTLYYAFKEYYDRIWNDENTTRVDLEKYR